jgi:hypothetical protein
VYNPLTQKHRELPTMWIGNSMIQQEWILTQMVMDRFTGAYKIIILTKKKKQQQHGGGGGAGISPASRKEDAAGAHMEVYDSHKHTWTVDFGLSVLERRYNLNFSQQVGACCDIFFYFVAREGICQGMNIMGLIVYDIFEGCCREKLLYRCEPRCPGSKIEVQVVECKGTVYMVVQEDDCTGTKGISFCLLNPSREQKIEDSLLLGFSIDYKWFEVQKVVSEVILQIARCTIPCTSFHHCVTWSSQILLTREKLLFDNMDQNMTQNFHMVNLGTLVEASFFLYNH